MAGPGLGPRTDISQIFFWTPGAHSSQRHAGGRHGTGPGPAGIAKAQGAMAALVLKRGLGGKRGTLQEEGSRLRVRMEVTNLGCR